MDPNAVAAPAQPALLVWIGQYGQYVAFFAQIIFWAGILLFAGYYVWTYKRYVNYKMGVGHSGALKNSDEADEAADEAPAKKSKKAEKVSVEEFVE